MSSSIKILWTGPALRDLESIRDYVAYDKPEAARRLADRIRKRIRDLRLHPESGRLVPEFVGHGYREVIVAPYRIVYEIAEETLIILRVWHGRRDLARLDLEGLNAEKSK